MKIQPSQREKLLILTTGVVLAIVLTLLLGKPLLASWRGTAMQYESKKGELQVMRETLARYPEWQKTHDELIRKSNIPDHPGIMPDVLRTVETIATEANVKVLRRNPQPPRDKGGFTEVAVEYSMEASIDTLVSFLYKVRTAQDLIDVTELKITPTPANPAILRADARLVSLRASGR